MNQAINNAEAVRNSVEVKGKQHFNIERVEGALETGNFAGGGGEVNMLNEYDEESAGENAEGMSQDADEDQEDGELQ